MPNLIGGIVLGYTWQLILNGIFGLFGRTLTYSASYGFWGLVILMCWQQVGYMMIIYIAGLQSIPAICTRRPASTAQLPPVPVAHHPAMSMPSITICLFLTLTNSFKLFDQNLALTAGLPGRQTQMLRLTSTIPFMAEPAGKA